MDAVTHGLIGAVVAQSGPSHRLGRPATVALITGALLPDVDFVMGFFDQMAAVKYHRGLTHSFIGGTFLALVVAVLLYKWKKGISYWTLASLVYVGICLHILSDLATSYGIMLFFPLSTKRYALDWVFILDPVYTTILFAGLVLGWWQSDRAVRYARVSMITLILYVMMASIGQQGALTRFRNELTATGIRPVQIGMFPELPGVFRWLGVAQEDAIFYESRIGLWDSSRLAIKIRRNNLSGEQLAQVAELDEVRAYLEFARFPWVQLKGTTRRPIVEYRDLRFGSHGRRESFLLRVMLDNASGEPEISFRHRF